MSSEMTLKPDPETASNTLPKNTKSHWLIDLWNQECGNLPKVKTLNATRRKKIKARLTEKNDQEYWKKVILEIKASPFCCGSNDRGWVADFDFLLKPNTHIKAVE